MTTSLEPIVTAFRRGDLDGALVLAEERLAASDRSAELRHLAGLIHCRQGRLDRGVELLREAVETEPENHAFRVMLVRALVDSGRSGEALAAADRPAGSSPPELALWHARAEAADLEAQYDASAEAWQMLLSVRSDDWRAWNNFGEALAKLERWDNAAAALRRATQLNPQEARIRRNFATALARAGSHEESAAEFQTLVDAEPNDSGLRLTLARLLSDLGRSADSFAQLDRAAELTIGDAALQGDEAGYIAIALGPDWLDSNRAGEITPEQTECVLELALLLERTSRMDALRTLLDQAERVGIEREALAYPAAAVELRDGNAERARDLLLAQPHGTDPVRWHRLMAKVMDKLGDTHSAFGHAADMNRAVHDFDRWRERGAAYRANVRDLAAAITPDWAGGLPRLGSGARPAPVFLVGFPRSGTTLLDTLLMGHPGTTVVEEEHMLGAAELTLGRFVDLPSKNKTDFERARDAYFAELDRHIDPAEAGLVVDKLPLNMLALPLISSLFADARIIFAQRHPCDAVFSGFMQSFIMNDAMAAFLTIEDAADLYDAAMDVFTRSRESLPVNVHTLVYEELVADPESALRPLVNFLGLEWNEQMLDHRETARKRGAIITPSYDQVVQPINREPSGRWRRYERELDPVLPVLLPWADRLGYAR